MEVAGLKASKSDRKRLRRPPAKETPHRPLEVSSFRRDSESTILQGLEANALCLLAVSGLEILPTDRLTGVNPSFLNH